MHQSTKSNFSFTRQIDLRIDTSVSRFSLPINETPPHTPAVADPPLTPLNASQQPSTNLSHVGTDSARKPIPAITKLHILDPKDVAQFFNKGMANAVSLGVDEEEARQKLAVEFLTCCNTSEPARREYYSNTLSHLT